MRTIKTHQYKDKILLLGFNSDLTEIKLSKGITIRKGTEEELNEIYDKIKYDNAKNQQFLVEYEYLESNESTFPKKLFRLLDDLNIFFKIFIEGETKVAYALRHLYSNGEFQSIGFVTNPKVRTYFLKDFFLDPSDSERIIKLWDKYQKQSENKTMQISLRRFLFSIEKHEHEDQIIDLIIAFEALFVRIKENKISQKMSERVAILLSEATNREKVFNFLRDAYNTRSQIVHGSSFELNSMNSKEKYLHLSGIVNTLSDLLNQCFYLKIVDFTEHSSDELIEELEKRLKTNS
ncbi:MAG: hypothetical protein V4604_02190 [Bacteroidota bacterium]